MEIPFKIAELDHLVLRCRDQALMLDFYTRVLGLREERRLDTMGLIQLRAGASLSDLVPASDPAIAIAANVDHFCLGVTAGDLTTMIAYLRSQGVAVIGEPALRYGARGSGLSIYIRDPEGNAIELKQIPPGTTAR